MFLARTAVAFVAFLAGCSLVLDNQKAGPDGGTPRDSGPGQDGGPGLPNVRSHYRVQQMAMSQQHEPPAVSQGEIGYIVVSGVSADATDAPPKTSYAGADLELAASVVDGLRSIQIYEFGQIDGFTVDIVTGRALVAVVVVSGLRDPVLVETASGSGMTPPCQTGEIPFAVADSVLLGFVLIGTNQGDLGLGATGQSVELFLEAFGAQGGGAGLTALAMWGPPEVSVLKYTCNEGTRAQLGIAVGER